MRAENRAEMKLRRRNIALTVAYDGTNYNGFQWQSPPRVAIQNVLENRLEKIFGDKIELASAGRVVFILGGRRNKLCGLKIERR